MPETPKHKDLWPLDVWDVVGWLIGVVTLFIAAGTHNAASVYNRTVACELMLM